MGRDDGGCQQRRHARALAAQPHVHHGRGGEAIRHRHPLAQVAAERRDVDPGHPGGHHQQPGVPGAGLGLHAQRRPDMPCLPPRSAGSLADTSNPISSTPRLRLRDLVTPVDKNFDPEPDGSFIDAGASTIYRENGKRMIALKFSVRGRDLGSAVDEAKAKTKDLFQIPYRAVWSGEFEQMEEANGRLMWIIPLSLASSSSCCTQPSARSWTRS